MLKYVNTSVVFQEIPDETTLAINISTCPCHCPGCHSKYLWEDIGEELTFEVIDGFVRKYGRAVTCIAFMGGDAQPAYIDKLAEYIHHTYPTIKVAWYSGRTFISMEINKQNFNYIKIGPYLAHLGPLNKKTTNQRLYRIEPDGEKTDITHKFWKK